MNIWEIYYSWWTTIINKKFMNLNLKSVRLWICQPHRHIQTGYKSRILLRMLNCFAIFKYQNLQYHNNVSKCITHHMSTFSLHGSLRITSGAIQAKVPAKLILVLTSFHSRHVPKSLIFTSWLLPMRTLKKIVKS